MPGKADGRARGVGPVRWSAAQIQEVDEGGTDPRSPPVSCCRASCRGSAVRSQGMEFLCICLRFPRTHLAVEAFFISAPSTMFEVMRYRLLGVGTLGAPLPAVLVPSWNPLLEVSLDNRMQFGAAVVESIQFFDMVAPDLAGAPDQALPPHFGAELSFLEWEVFSATLRMPAAHSDVVQMLSDRSLFYQAADIEQSLPLAATLSTKPACRSRRRRRL